MTTHNDNKITPPELGSSERRGAQADASYEHPSVIDHGSLRELTLSGMAPLSDSFGGAAGGGS